MSTINSSAREGGVLFSQLSDGAITAAAATLVINPVATDDMINFAEAEAEPGITVSGTSSLANADLTVTLGSGSYTTQTDASGGWSVIIPSHTLSYPAGAYPDGNYTLTASVADGSGNSQVASRALYLNSDGGSLPSGGGGFENSVNNGAEHRVGQTINGWTTNVEAGQEVILHINERVYTTQVQADGSWQVILSAEEVASLPNGTGNLWITVTDRAGNPVEPAIARFTFEDSLPGIAIDTVAGDNIINSAEAQGDVVIQGIAHLVAAGTPVTLALGSLSYSTQVQADGSWSVTVPAADVQALGDTQLAAVVETTDEFGNPLSDSLQLVTDIIDTPQLYFDPFAGDDVLNVQEQATDQYFTGHAYFVEPGQIVTLHLGNFTYSAVVDTFESWSVLIPASDLGQFSTGPVDITATVADRAGNTAFAEGSLYVNLNVGSLTLDPIAGDNQLNAAEGAQDLVISGDTEGVPLGNGVNVILNGKIYFTSVINDAGHWSVTIPAADLAQLPDGPNTVAVNTGDSAGNSLDITQTLMVYQDNLPSLRINPVSGDNVLNGAEVQSDQIISGTTRHVQSGQTVELEADGVTYSAVVQADGRWSLIIPAEAVADFGNGREVLRASVSDVAGNPATASRAIHVHSHRDGLSIDPVTGDNLINASEADGAIALSGHTEGVARGALVHLTLNGQHYSARVGRDGSWSARIPAADAAALEEGTATLTAHVRGAHGRMLCARATLTVDLTAPSLALAPVTGDNLITLQEAQAGFALTGTASAAAAGLLVMIMLDGVSYHAPVQADGSWTAAIPAGALADQPAGELPLAISLSDLAGNLAQVNSVLTLAGAEEARAPAADESALMAAPAAAEVAATPDQAEETGFIGGLRLESVQGEAVGGSGDDTLLLTSAEVAHIDGGAGIDTLLLAGSDQHLDLAALGLKIEHIEIVDLGQSGSNSLALGLHEAQTLKDTPDESLLIKGAAGSQLNLVGDGSLWTESGERQLDGLLFDVYHNSALESDNTLGDVLVQQGIVVHQI
ncbi:Ig-like domain-containing protein [Nissabacter sp. SGAir0207]|uniref:Ig-like domain-containing protein n=1 Tax=Nissabacter sp. SGAir0207 TaxID=2126321 RepID=UPI0010CCCA69|nr:Ig-like domain-containing protein [Nissabacter sp. SGAir0207]QCR35527.1 hypothetical protein C1N62_05210 [Nissabacter sp. SGAir0207]